MALYTKKIDGATITYYDDQAARDAVFEKLLAWFIEFKAFDGDTIFQSDDPNLDSPHVLGEIADDIFKFDAVYDED